MKVTVVGPFPPPIHGMAKNLKLFSEHISNKSDVLNIDISPGSINRGKAYHFTKLKKVIVGLYILIKHSFQKEVASIYMPPDAGLGAYYSLLFVVVSKVFNIPLYLHHRSFAYINRKTVGMRLITFFEPKSTTHIFLCEKMQEGFNKNYKLNKPSLVVSNAQYVEPINKIQPLNECIVIGHLSNLGFEKGLGLVIELCEKLLDMDVNFKLELAGPTENHDTQKYLELKLKKMGHKVTYHGLVSGDKKNDFYSKLDLFLFPTQYRNEAQPNVLFEANAFGVPVLTLNVGCISADVNCQNGFIFSSKELFVEESLEVIEKLNFDKSKLYELKCTTLEKTKEASEQAKQSYQNLLQLVSGHSLK